ncbi:hypothetical protein ACN08X_02530 [Rothia sp. P6271]|uniref:hypothetical protein n=1 Tax=Rothia sp. P6271 TaxID=3402659 RepID=UPI003AD5D3F8
MTSNIFPKDSEGNVSWEQDNVIWAEIHFSYCAVPDYETEYGLDQDGPLDAGITDEQLTELFSLKCDDVKIPDAEQLSSHESEQPLEQDTAEDEDDEELFYADDQLDQSFTDILSDTPEIIVYERTMTAVVAHVLCVPDSSETVEGLRVVTPEKDGSFSLGRTLENYAQQIQERIDADMMSIILPRERDYSIELTSLGESLEINTFAVGTAATFPVCADVLREQIHRMSATEQLDVKDCESGWSIVWGKSLLIAQLLYQLQQPAIMVTSSAHGVHIACFIPAHEKNHDWHNPLWDTWMEKLRDGLRRPLPLFDVHEGYLIDFFWGASKNINPHLPESLYAKGTFLSEMMQQLSGILPEPFQKQRILEQLEQFMWAYNVDENFMHRLHLYLQDYGSLLSAESVIQLLCAPAELQEFFREICDATFFRAHEHQQEIEPLKDDLQRAIFVTTEPMNEVETQKIVESLSLLVQSSLAEPSSSSEPEENIEEDAFEILQKNPWILRADAALTLSISAVLGVLAYRDKSSGVSSPLKALASLACAGMGTAEFLWGQKYLHQKKIEQEKLEPTAEPFKPQKSVLEELREYALEVEKQQQEKKQQQHQGAKKHVKRLFRSLRSRFSEG